MALAQDEDKQPQQDLHKTCISRRTVAQEIVVVLPPADFLRRVQVFIPGGRSIYLDEDRPVALNEDGTAPPGLAGRNRNYKLPLFDSSQNIEFTLYPGQSLVGCCGEGLAHLTLIVEPIGGA